LMYDSLHEVPDGHDCVSASGMTGGAYSIHRQWRLCQASIESSG
jgi:hypothetical protein